MVKCIILSHDISLSAPQAFAFFSSRFYVTHSREKIWSDIVSKFLISLPVVPCSICDLCDFFSLFAPLFPHFHCIICDEDFFGFLLKKETLIGWLFHPPRSSALPLSIDFSYFDDKFIVDSSLLNLSYMYVIVMWIFLSLSTTTCAMRRKKALLNREGKNEKFPSVMLTRSECYG